MNRTYVKWELGLLDELKKLIPLKYSASIMARELGVTRNSVIGAMWRLRKNKSNKKNKIKPTKIKPPVEKKPVKNIIPAYQPPKERKKVTYGKCFFPSPTRPNKQLPEERKDGFKSFQDALGGCMWCASEPDTNTWCGKPTEMPMAFCPEHMAICYEKQKPISRMLSNKKNVLNI